jgi:agmatinase
MTQSKQDKINNFDPNGLAAAEANIYGLPFTEEESEIVILPLPWDVTVSYSDGTSKGPEAVYEASKQVDLYDAAVANAWKIGHFMRPINEEWRMISEKTRAKAIQIIEDLESGNEDDDTAALLNQVNEACISFHQQVEKACDEILATNKIIIGLGGDHSTPLGILKSLAKKHNDFAILQFDAHCDLRIAYEGFTYSHASIMYNVLNEIKEVSKLVQLGIRDYCEDELNMINDSKNRIITFFDRYIKQVAIKGRSFADLTTEMIASLPQKVYVSFDIDALDPKLCPNTGTPVAGGFELEQAFYILEELVKSGRTIIGADINEVAPGENEWDANVGARLLYRLCNLTAKSNGKI